MHRKGHSDGGGGGDIGIGDKKRSVKKNVKVEKKKNLQQQHQQKKE